METMATTTVRDPDGRRGGGSPERIAHPSVEERGAHGKAARGRVRRSDHAAWQPSGERLGPVDLLREQAAEREPELVPRTLVPEAALWVALHMTDTAPHSKPRRRRLAPALDLVACVPAFPATLAVGVNRQALDSALPPRAQPLAGPAAGPLRDRIELRARETSSRPADARILET
jgi:hypothetical protein